MLALGPAPQGCTVGGCVQLGGELFYLEKTSLREIDSAGHRPCTVARPRLPPAVSTASKLSSTDDKEEAHMKAFAVQILTLPYSGTTSKADRIQEILTAIRA